MSELTSLLQSLPPLASSEASLVSPQLSSHNGMASFNPKGQREVLDDNLDYVLVSEPTNRFLSVPRTAHAYDETC